MDLNDQQQFDQAAAAARDAIVGLVPMVWSVYEAGLEAGFTGDQALDVALALTRQMMGNKNGDRNE